MQQIKIFHGHEDATQDLEQTVNQWLVESGVKVVQVFGNMSAPGILSANHATPMGGVAGSGGSHQRYAPSDVLLVVVYEMEEG